MRISAVGAALVVMLAGATGWSQTNRLGDVAGSITLDPAAIVEKSGYTDDPRAAARADAELLAGVLADCSVVADQVATLVGQARRAAMMRDTEVLTRLEEAALELDRQVEELGSLRLTSQLRGSADAARRAGGSCSSAAATVIDDIRSRTVFTRSRDAVAGCRRELADAEQQLAESAPGAPTASSPAPQTGPGEPRSVEEVITRICRSSGSTDPDAVERCRAEQSLAQAAIESREPGNEMLDAGVFGDIRQACLELHPRNFVERDRCEQERMTAARLDNE